MTMRTLGASHEIATTTDPGARTHWPSSLVVRAVSEVVASVHAADLTDEEVASLRVYYIPADPDKDLPIVVGWKVGPFGRMTLP